MSVFKKHKVVMLPATRSKLYYSTTSRKLEVTPVVFLQSGIIRPKHLYIVDEDSIIKEGDWVLIKGKERDYVKQSLVDHSPNNGAHKIVASTDPNIQELNLTEDKEVYFTPIPEPSMAFLERYCSKNGISPVMVEYDGDKIRVSNSNTITIKPVEEVYSREEVEALLDDLFHDAGQDYDGFYKNYDSLEDWKQKNLK